MQDMRDNRIDHRLSDINPNLGRPEKDHKSVLPYAGWTFSILFMAAMTCIIWAGAVHAWAEYAACLAVVGTSVPLFIPVMFTLIALCAARSTVLMWQDVADKWSKYKNEG